MAAIACHFKAVAPSAMLIGSELGLSLCPTINNQLYIVYDSPRLVVVSY